MVKASTSEDWSDRQRAQAVGFARLEPVTTRSSRTKRARCGRSRALSVSSFGGAGLVVDTQRGLWIALYYRSLMVVLALPCAHPVSTGDRLDRIGGWRGLSSQPGSL